MELLGPSQILDNDNIFCCCRRCHAYWHLANSRPLLLPATTLEEKGLHELTRKERMKSRFDLEKKTQRFSGK